MTPAPSWTKDVQRTKVTGREPDPAGERAGAFCELRLRYVKVIGDNIQLRNLLAAAEKMGKARRRRKRGPERNYEQEHEYAPGRTSDDATDDLVAIGDRLRGQDREW
jgi:hypothetical protein